jgi:hypothetical protein
MRIAKKNHLEDHPIPEGFCIYEERLEIRGVESHRAAAENFCRSLDRRLAFATSSPNSDRNAIGVIGTSQGWTGIKEELLGHVPKECAGRLVAADLLSVIAPRLSTTYVDDKGMIEIEFQIIGPETSYRRYQADLSDHEETSDETILDLLADAIAETEGDSGAYNLPVTPWPYIVMAKMFRKMGMLNEERAILERYDAQKKPIGKIARLLDEQLREVRRRAR